MTGGPSYITEEGLEKAKEEVAFLKSTRRREIAERIERAKELGDLSENAEYAQAKDEQAFLEGHIVELENLINTAVIISNQRTTDMVEVGSTITVSVDGQTRQFTIVGSNEADPLKGRISNESPLGEAFLGKKVNDVVEVTVPKGIVHYSLLKIE